MESSWIPFAIAVGLPYTVSTAESLSDWQRNSIKNWYSKLKKASWNPPNWIFGPVWTIIYGLMGYASYLVWREGQISTSEEVQAKVSFALTLYGVQLLLNWLWTPLFFKYHLLGFSLFEFAVLWVAVAATIVSFNAVNALSAYLLIPYIMWGTYAITLNFYVWANNKSEGKRD